MWPHPCIVSSVAQRIRIPNLLSDSLTLRRNEHFGQATLTFKPNNKIKRGNPVRLTHTTSTAKSHSSSIVVDPDNLLPQEIKEQFHAVLKEYDSVFTPHFKGYNGAAGSSSKEGSFTPVQPWETRRAPKIVRPTRRTRCLREPRVPQPILSCQEVQWRLSPRNSLR